MHPYADASSCVWPKQMKQVRGKPIWVNVDDDESWNACSCLEYSFQTLVSLHRVLDTAKLMVPCPKSGKHDAQCPFPCGFVSRVVIPRWVNDECVEPEDLPVVVLAGDPCFILGSR